MTSERVVREDFDALRAHATGRPEVTSPARLFSKIALASTIAASFFAVAYGAPGSPAVVQFWLSLFAAAALQGTSRN